MKRFIAVAALCALTVGLLLPTSAGAQAPAHSQENATVHSDEAAVPIDVAITIFKPAIASVTNQVPVVLHSHGWAGSRTTDITAFANYLDAGIGVVSFDQRGHGESGGEANVQDPELEAEDVKAIIDHVADLDWVKLDVDADGNPIAGDPVLGAIGASYGGGYQTITALDEIDETGTTRFNALAPQITWYDLPESLAPQDVIRSAWNAVLYGGGKAQATLPSFIDEAFAFGTATGQWPDGKLLDEDSPVPIPNIDERFHAHSPVSFAEQDIKLDIPVLFRQGLSDNLFNLNQAWNNFNKTLTPAAQSHSILVGFNGGHALPNALPLGAPVAAELGGGVDACSGGVSAAITSWEDLELAFLQAAFDGEETGDLLGAHFNLTDLDGVTCHRFNAPSSTLTLKPTEGIDPTGEDGMVVPVGAGGPIQIPLNVPAGTVIAGVPTLSGAAYAGAVDTRVLVGLSLGNSPADARVIQNNLMPLHFEQPAIDEDFDIELAGVAVTVGSADAVGPITVPNGKQLFLTITPVSDMFFGSRIPGAMVLTGLTLKLPVLL